MDRSILSHITRHVNLTKVEEDFFISILLPVKLKQGEFAEKGGEITYNFIHVNSGCLMTYFTDKEGDDQVIQFATSGWWTGDLQSLTTQQPSIY